MGKGEIVAWHNNKMFVVRRCKKTPVTMLFTADVSEMLTVKTRSFENKLKLKCVTIYNANMAAEDKSDMMVSFSGSTRKTIKLYQNFFPFIQNTCFECFFMFRENQNKTNPNIKSRIMDFRLYLIRQLLQDHLTAKNNGKNVVYQSSTYSDEIVTIHSTGCAHSTG